MAVIERVGGLRAGYVALVRPTALGLEVLVTERMDDKGWELPGGGPNTTDANDDATALREAMEEVGVDLSRVTVVRRFVIEHAYGGHFLLLVLLAPEGYDPPLQLCPKEVANAEWRLLYSQECDEGIIPFQAKSFLGRVRAHFGG